MILSSLISRSVLTFRPQQIDVVAAYKVLRQVDDGRCQTNFSVVVRRVFSNVTNELRDLQ